MLWKSNKRKAAEQCFDGFFRPFIKVLKPEFSEDTVEDLRTAFIEDATNGSLEMVSLAAQSMLVRSNQCRE